MEDLELKKEKANLKKNWTNAFLLELDEILEKCFLKPKSKKEHFITQDKITIELLKLLQSQKKFQPTISIKSNLNSLGVFDLTENLIGKIKNIDLEKKEVEFLSIFSSIKKRSFLDVYFFDIFSPEMPFYFEKQKKFYDAFSYKDVFAFLTHDEKMKDKKEENVRYSTVSGEQKVKITIPIDYNH